MFFYISFLRPPATQSFPSGSISITPQVSNDLRTEPFDGAQDIYYSWSPVTPQRAEPYPSITVPQKLTVWRQSSAYKEIPVPLPQGLRDGQSYRLVLTAHGQGRPHIINLAAQDIGTRPFPVLSMPILFSSRGKAGSGAEKQEQIERVYRIPLQSGENGFLNIREQTSFDLDKKIWDSGIGLSSWLVELAQESPPPDGEHSVAKLCARDALFASGNGKIIELGAGTGIVSLTLGALRSALPHNKTGCILTTDLGSAMPLLEHNVSANASLYDSTAIRPQPLVLDWDDEQLPERVAAVDTGFDAIVMADVTYNTASFPSLVRTLSSLIRLSSPHKTPIIILGYKERDAAERTLWDMVREIGITFEQVGQRAGAGGQAIEIWIGRCNNPVTVT
ncbi:putative methyltransferase-domain-containing protein [Trametes polyzona]|nr:putative methyltransferase-domain-containing protein [Trametes polyzona]